MNLIEQYIREALLLEMYVKGEGDNIIAFGANIWRYERYQEMDDAVAQDIVTNLGFDDEDAVEQLQSAFLKGTWIVEENGRQDVLVGEIDGNQLRIFIDGTFEFDPKSSVLVKKVVKQLGLSGAVSLSGESEIETDISQMLGKIAMNSAFHGTSTTYFESIMSKGIRPRNQTMVGSNYNVQHEDLIFFTTRFTEAMNHATHTPSGAGGDAGGKPIIFEFRIPDEAKVTPDFDVDIAGRGENQDFTNQSDRLGWGGNDQTKMKASSMSLSREFGIYGYRGSIPPKFITKLYILREDTDYPEAEDFTGITIKELHDMIEEYKEERWEMYLEDYDYDEEELADMGMSGPEDVELPDEIGYILGLE